MKKSYNKAFTLVELLAVIVILAIILVIAVPKIMDVINSSKKSTLETSVKMIASSAEKTKMQNTILGKEDEEITCSSVAKLSSNDYDLDNCTITFDKNNNASVTIKGKGKFEGLNVCGGTKNEATAQTEMCQSTPTASETIAALVTADGEVQKTTATYNSTTYDAGIRYTGANPNNYVLFNCDDPSNTNTCETWRIIGVFDVDNGNGTIEKRVKIINTESTFKASWDSSDGAVNNGYGINQWFPSTKTDGSEYEGADLYRLLNGFYIGKSNTCTYCDGQGQETCSNTCTKDSLTSANMKPLTSSAKNLISNAKWYTYGVDDKEYDGYGSTNIEVAYLQEMGISKQQTGKKYYGGDRCNDTVERTTSGSALIGLMSLSDIGYANGWLYNDSRNLYPWSITPYVYFNESCGAWSAGDFEPGYYQTFYERAHFSLGVFPSVYLKSNVQINSGTGAQNDPYILKLSS